MALVDATPRTFQDSVLAAFNSFWADRTPVAWPNKTFDPDAAFPAPAADDAWVSVTLLGSAEGELDRGSSIYQREGTLSIQLFVRGDSSTDLFTQLQDAALEFLEVRSPDVKDGFMRNARFQEAGEDGVWYTGTATADWTYFTNRT